MLLDGEQSVKAGRKGHWLEQNYGWAAEKLQHNTQNRLAMRSAECAVDLAVFLVLP